MRCAVNRWLVFTLAPCLLLPLVLAAGEFWLDKPSKDWTEKEAETVLSKSPWGKDQMSVIRGKRPWGRAGQDVFQGDRQSQSQGQRRQPIRLDEDLETTVIFRVVWYSSAHVQQALARLGQLRGLPEGSAEPQNVDLATNYIVGVDTSSLGSDRLLKVFEDATQELLKASTSLQSRKNASKSLFPRTGFDPSYAQRASRLPSNRNSRGFRMTMLTGSRKLRNLSAHAQKRSHPCSR